VARRDHDGRNPDALGVRLRGRRRDDAQPVRVRTDRREARGGGVGEHPPGGTAVAGDGDGLGVPDRAGRAGDAADEPRGDRLADHPADAAGPEDFHQG
jgi:hypothetical protein